MHTCILWINCKHARAIIKRRGILNKIFCESIFIKNCQIKRMSFTYVEWFKNSCAQFIFLLQNVRMQWRSLWECWRIRFRMSYMYNFGKLNVLEIASEIDCHGLLNISCIIFFKILVLHVVLHVKIVLSSLEKNLHFTYFIFNKIFHSSQSIKA